MQYTLTRNEARIIRAMNDEDGANFHELASMAQMTPNEDSEVAQLLAKREFVNYDEADRYLYLTEQGHAVREALVKSSLKSSQSYAEPSVSIVSDEEAAAESPLDAMDSAELEAAFEGEIGKLD